MGGIMPDREATLARTFVDLTDTLVDHFDIVELMTFLADRCVELLDVTAAGIMLASPEGDLRLIASSSEEMRLLELFELETSDGPCLDCYRTGKPVVNHDLSSAGDSWPMFAPQALRAGFRSAEAIPMRLRESTLGALNLFHSAPAQMTIVDIGVAQALADVATIGLLHQRALTRADVVNEQLNAALNSRVTIEQAKGILNERLGLDMDQAFRVLRNHARTNNLLLADLAHDIVTASVGTDAIVSIPAD